MTRSRSDELVDARLARCLHLHLTGQLTDEALVKGLRRLALDIERGQVLQVAERPSQAADRTAKAVSEVYEYWRTRIPGRARAKLTPGRRKVLRARLQEGYTVPQLRQAIDGLAASEWHQGANELGKRYDDLTSALRNGERVERFIADAQEQGEVAPVSGEVARLQEEANDALRRGDTEAYNAANARIGTIRAAAAGG